MKRSVLRYFNVLFGNRCFYAWFNTHACISNRVLSRSRPIYTSFFWTAPKTKACLRPCCLRAEPTTSTSHTMNTHTQSTDWHFTPLSSCSTVLETSSYIRTYYERTQLRSTLIVDNLQLNKRPWPSARTNNITNRQISHCNNSKRNKQYSISTPSIVTDNAVWIIQPLTETYKTSQRLWAV